MVAGKRRIRINHKLTTVANLPVDRARRAMRLAVLIAGMFVLAASGAAIASVSSGVESASFQSRELVDVEYLGDRSLAVLVSSPGAATPGLYRWYSREPFPRKLCDIAAVSAFSFDRKTVIERERGFPSRVRVYAPEDCALLAALEIPGRVLDVDVFGRLLAAAVRLPGGTLEMQLYRLNGELVASNSVGRNVEMGFSPDGRFIVNFDLSDAGLQAWRVPRVVSTPLPTWLQEGDTTFVPGSRFLKRYAEGKLSVVRWPSGHVVQSIAATRALRLRALTLDARFGLAHELQGATEALQWIDFTRDQRIVLARGSIDNAAIARDVSQAAWSLRLPGREQRVLVQRRSLSGAIRNMPLPDLPLEETPDASAAPGPDMSVLPKAAASAPALAH